MQEYQLKDQGEWERCRSSRRMFLALIDAGRKRDLCLIARKLLQAAEKRLPKAEATKQARFYWKNGLRDEDNPAKELADRVYLVMRYVSEALDRHPSRLWPHGGEVAICQLVRSLVPLAPNGFRKVGSLEGSPGKQGISAQQIPHRAMVRGTVWRPIEA